MKSESWILFLSNRSINGKQYQIISSIVLNEIPFNIVKRCNNQSLRRWYTIINIFKTTLYALYYRRPLFDRNGIVIYPVAPFYIKITSPPPILARIQQTFFGDQHKNKKYFPFLSLRAKKGFEIQLQRYLQDQFLPGRYIMIQFR